MVEEVAGGLDGYRQLLLVGHGGRAIWEAIQASGFADSADAFDEFSVAAIEDAFGALAPDCGWKLLYPGEAGPPYLPIQRLGERAGWHHPSPFLVGINHVWGSWFAYRAVVVADSAFPVTIADSATSPCGDCASRPCVAACPAGAITDAGFDLKACVQYRQRPKSNCAHQCVARNACPVAANHRYTPAQMYHHYSRSLQTINATDHDRYGQGEQQ